MSLKNWPSIYLYLRCFLLLIFLLTITIAQNFSSCLCFNFYFYIPTFQFAMTKVNVKFGAKVIEVDVDLDQPPLLLKAQLYELTSVLPERQKLIVKGKTIQDGSWSGLKIQDGTTIMLVGGTGPTSIIQAAKEESATGQGDGKGGKAVLPVGLRNLGNTCYMNASLQCFKVIPELEAALRKYKMVAGNDGQRSRLVTNSLKQLYAEMDRLKSDDSPTVIPLIFLHILHQSFPQFATQDERGQFQQQDANECFSEVLRLVSEEVTCANQSSSANSENAQTRLKRIFEVEYDVNVKCLEEGSVDAVQHSTETVNQLSCYLEQEVRYIQSGIKNKMTEEIEKHSESLGRNAKYEKRVLISRLPAYLSIQMVRFFYKEREGQATGINAKVLKDVKFPLVLDVFDLCTQELQERLKPAREAIKEYDEAKVELMRRAKLAHNEDASKFNVKPVEAMPNTFAEDVGSNNNGIYELKGLITHKGRASNSGHYVAWIRVGEEDEESGKGKWVCCDDDDVSPVGEEEILKLSGGGDWHCAYVLLYGPKKILKLDLPKEE